MVCTKFQQVRRFGPNPVVRSRGKLTLSRIFHVRIQKTKRASVLVSFYWIGLFVMPIRGCSMTKDDTAKWRKVSAALKTVGQSILSVQSVGPTLQIENAVPQRIELTLTAQEQF